MKTSAKFGTPKNLSEELLNGNYTYVYIYKISENFKNIYKELFKNEIKDKTLYKINPDNLLEEVVM